MTQVQNCEECFDYDYEFAEQLPSVVRRSIPEVV
jgi:hypothetical protein